MKEVIFLLKAHYQEAHHVQMVKDDDSENKAKTIQELDREKLQKKFSKNAIKKQKAAVAALVEGRHKNTQVMVDKIAEIFF